MRRHRTFRWAAVFGMAAAFAMAPAHAPLWAAPPHPPIDRVLGALRLGMSVEQFQAAVPGDEQTGPENDLMPEERLFAVLRGGLPEGARGSGVRFLHGRLYRITADYREGTFDEARWKDLIGKNTERYGPPISQNRNVGERVLEILQWDDPKTRLVIQRELRMRIENKKMVKKFTVLIMLLDRELWKERSEYEMSWY